MTVQLHNGDVFEHITTLESRSVDRLFTDPPYNMSSKWEISEETGMPALLGKGSDYKNQWSALNGGQLREFFSQAYRVLRNGGYALVFGIDRQLFPFQYYAALAGFELCQALYWYTTQNMPKGVHQPRYLWSEENKQLFDGYYSGIAPFKQSLETIMVLRKPVLVSITADIEYRDEANATPAVVDIEHNRVGTGRGGWNGTGTSTYKGLDKDQDARFKVGKYPAQLFVDPDTAALLDAQNTKAKDVISTNLQKCAYELGYAELATYAAKVKTPKDDVLHPTLKPVSLTTHIARLFMLPTPTTWYVPFAGTCSEILGILKAHVAVPSGPVTIIGCELDEDFLAAGKQRLDAEENITEQARHHTVSI